MDLVIEVIDIARMSMFDAAVICDRLSNPGSDFQRVLRVGISGGSLAGHLWGSIAIVRMPSMHRADTYITKDEPVGWARASAWYCRKNNQHGELQSLEAFVAPEIRGTGVCSAALMALAACRPIRSHRGNAVFSDGMAAVCRGVGISFTQFRRDPVDPSLWIKCEEGEQR